MTFLDNTVGDTISYAPGDTNLSDANAYNIAEALQYRTTRGIRKTRHAFNKDTLHFTQHPPVKVDDADAVFCIGHIQRLCTETFIGHVSPLSHFTVPGR